MSSIQPYWSHIGATQKNTIEEQDVGWGKNLTEDLAAVWSEYQFWWTTTLSEGSGISCHEGDDNRLYWAQESASGQRNKQQTSSMPIQVRSRFPTQRQVNWGLSDYQMHQRIPRGSPSQYITLMTSSYFPGILWYTLISYCLFAVASKSLG